MKMAFCILKLICLLTACENAQSVKTKNKRNLNTCSSWWVPHFKMLPSKLCTNTVPRSSFSENCLVCLWTLRIRLNSDWGCWRLHTILSPFFFLFSVLASNSSSMDLKKRKKEKSTRDSNQARTSVSENIEFIGSVTASGLRVSFRNRFLSGTICYSE